MNNNIGIEQNGHSSSASVHFDYFLVGRGADKSLLYNETSSNSYAMTYLPNLSLVRCTFKNKKILFNGSFSYEINDFFQHSIDNKHTLYTINDLKKIIKANGGSIEELTQFLGYAARLVVEAPLELDGTEGTKKDEQRQGENNGIEGEAENGKKKEQKSDDDDAIGGLESDDDSDKDSVLTTLFDSMDSQKKCNTKKTTASVEKGPFFKFVKTIVNNLIDWGTERHRGRHMTAETEQGSIKRPKFCAKLRLKIGNEWRWEDHFFNEFANNNTGEVLRIVRVPIATENDDAKFVLNDVFILRYARDEMDTLPTDLNALFAEEQFDCRVVIVEEAPAKITNFL